MLLVTGAQGQLGTALKMLLGDRAVYAGRAELDIGNEQAVKAFFAARSFDMVINCAAYTAVDRAEDESDAAGRVNALGPALLARYGRRIIQISTDYVFDGRKGAPYTEEDPVHPLSVYGRTKREGETAVLREAETAVVVRTAWLYSPVGRNFLNTMRRLGAGQESVGVVSDQLGSPTSAIQLADAIVSMLPRLKSGQKGIWHYCCEGTTSWCEFAASIMQKYALPCRVIPLSTGEYPTRAVRPAYSVLDTEKIKRDFDLVIPHWREALKLSDKLYS